MHDPEPFQSALMSEGFTDASTYVQTDLVSNISGLAEVTDLNLINPWGVSFLPGTPRRLDDLFFAKLRVADVESGTSSRSARRRAAS